MNPEPKVTNLELSKQLKKAGYKQEGLWWYKQMLDDCATSGSDTTDATRNYPMIWTLQQNPLQTNEYLQAEYVAPTVAELGEKLKMFYYDCRFMPNYRIPKWKIVFEGQEIGRELTEANARAKLWLYLKKENLL